MNKSKKLLKEYIMCINILGCYIFSNFCTQIQSKKEMKIFKVRSDHGGEYENESVEAFCEKHGVVHEFSSPRTPQQNGVVERKNRTLQEMAITMIHENNLANISRQKQ